MCAITRQAQLRSIHHVFKFKECHHPHPTPPHPTPPHPQKLQFGHGVVNPAVSIKNHPPGWNYVKLYVFHAFLPFRYNTGHLNYCYIPNYSKIKPQITTAYCHLSIWKSFLLGVWLGEVEYGILQNPQKYSSDTLMTVTKTWSKCWPLARRWASSGSFGQGPFWDRRVGAQMFS